MKKILILTFIGFLASCDNNSSNTSENNQNTINAEPAELEQPVKENALNKVEKTGSVFKDFIYLYSELLDIKANPSFKANGFDQSFGKWLKNIEILLSNPDSKLLISKGILVADLQNLGLAYAGSKGTETQITRTFNKIFLDAIPPSSMTVYGKNDYQKLKKESKLVAGKWIIKIAMYNNTGYSFEIYKKGNKYIGILPQDPFRQLILVKKGDSFSVDGDKYKDYLIITLEEFDLKG